MSLITVRACLSALTGLAALALLPLCLPAVASAAIVQNFYIPVPEDHYRLYARAQTVTAQADVVRSVVSVTGTFDATIAYYDQWEDGYEDDPASPGQSTTQVWGDQNPANGAPPVCSTLTGICIPCVVSTCDVVNAGTVVTLLSDVPVANGIRDQGNLYYDARDRISTTQQLVVTRSMWPIGPPSTIVAQLAGAVEVLDTGKWGTAFQVPVGTDNGQASFTWTALSIMAENNGTVVTIRNPEATPTIDTTVTLNQGEIYFIGGRNVLTFNSGGTSPVLVGDTLQGATSTTTATVETVTLTSGSWAGGDAAGFLTVTNVVGVAGAFDDTFSAAENLNKINATAFPNIATVTAINGIKVGATVTSQGGPIQVDMLTAQNNSGYDGRLYPLLPTASLGDTYYCPVSTTQEVGGTQTTLSLIAYNPGAGDITVTPTCMATTVGCPAAQLIAPKAAAVFLMPLSPNFSPPARPSNVMTGAKLSSTAPFYALAAIDMNVATHNWGFTLIPTVNLTPTVIVGWAPGTTDQQRDASPVWVTPASSNPTTVYVDYDGDPAFGPNSVTVGGKTVYYDVSYVVQPYQAQKIFSPGPAGAFDHTKWRIFTVDGTRLAAAWGQDGNSSSAGQPTEFDLGTTVLPAPSLVAYKTSALIGDFNANGGTDPGELIEYTIRVFNGGVIPITNVVLTDTNDPNVTYVAETTDSGSTASGPFLAIPDSPPGTFPLAGGYTLVASPAQLDPGQEIFIRYQTTVKNPLAVVGATNLLNTVTATTASIAQLTITSEDWTSLQDTAIQQGGLSAVKLSSMGDATVKPGDTIDYTVFVTNTSNSPQTGVTFTDPLPAGTTYVVQSTVAKGPQQKYVRDRFNSLAYTNNDGPQSWAAAWNEADSASGGAGATAGDVQVFNGELRLSEASYVAKAAGSALNNAERRVDLTGFPYATLRFKYRTNPAVRATDVAAVDISSDGTSFTNLGTFTGIAGNSIGTRAYDVSAYANSPNTTVRVRVAGGNMHAIDNFAAQAYTNNDGPFPPNTNWKTIWVENDPADGSQLANVGSVQVSTAANQGLRINNPTPLNAVQYARRTVDLSSGTPTFATLNYYFNRAALVANESVVVECAAAAGGPYLNLATYNSATAIGAKSLDILALQPTCISANTTIQFRNTSTVAGAAGHYFYFDSVEVRNDSYGVGRFFYADNVEIRGIGYRDAIDNFGSVSFANNDGPTLWKGAWTETDPAGGTQSPSSGNLQVVSALSPRGLRLNHATAGATSASRSVDLGGATNALLRLNFETSSGVVAGDAVVVEVSSAVAGPFTVLEAFTGIAGAASGSRVYDITPQISADTTVRIGWSAGYGGATTYFYAKNIEIREGAYKDVLDMFHTASYSNSDGPNAWAGAWAETDPDGGGAGGGNIQAVAVSGLRFNNATAGATSALRTVDLTSAGFNTALLKFNLATSADVALSDAVVVEAASAPGGPFTVLDTFTNIAGVVRETRAYDITPHLAATTTVRFRVLNGYTGTATYFYADDVEIRAWRQLETTKDNLPAGANPDLLNGTPPALVAAADGFSIAPGETIRVDYSVTVANPPNATRATNTASVNSKEQTQPSASTVINPISLGGSIVGTVWLDSLVNGSIEGGEPGFFNTRVWLDTNGNDVYDPGVDLQSYTGTDGKYRFSGLYPAAYPGTYKVFVDETTLPTGLARTTGNTGPITRIITNPVAPEQFKDVDFGYKNGNPGAAIIGQSVWSDANNNGVWDSGEVGIGSNLVTLDNFGTQSYAVNDGPNAWNAGWSETDAGGAGPAAGNVQVAVGQGLRLNTAGSMAERSADLSTAIFASALLKFNFSTENFGVGDAVDVQVSSDGVSFTTLETITSASAATPRAYDISSKVSANTTVRFSVTGSDGVNHHFYANNVEIDAGGVIMQLLVGASGSTVAATTMTNAFGTYLFTDVPPGTYRVQADATSLLAGYALTAGADSVGVNPSPTGGLLVAGGNSYLMQNFGYYDVALHTISDRVWFDQNGNGAVTSGEPGLSGVTVNLLDPNGTVIGSTVSDTAGKFTFSGVRDGSYTIAIQDADGKLLGYAGTTAAAQARELAVTVSGANVSGANFGYNAPGLIGNTVWTDTNSNGLQDAGEPGIANVTVRLYGDTNGNGLYDVGVDQRVATKTTDTNGEYLFQVGQPGKYFVSVDGAQAPLSGLVLTTPDTQAAAGYQRTVNLLTLSSSNLTADFGLNGGGRIGRIIWNDLNANGVVDASETGIPGVTVLLYKDANANGTFESGVDTYVATRTTDATGGYAFNLNTLGTGTGTYFISVDSAQPALAVLTLTTPDDQTEAGVQRTVMVSSLGANYMTANSGFYTPATDLSVIKTASPAGDVYPGDTITYTVTVTNNSASVTQTGIRIDDPLPTNTSYVAASASVSRGFKYATADSAAANPDRDTFIDQAAPGNNNGGATTLNVQYSTGGLTRRGLMHFPLPALPAWSVINLATAQFTVSTANANISNINLFRMVRGTWLEGTGTNAACGGAGNGATWNQYDCDSNWVAAGGDFDSAILLGSFSPASVGAKSVATEAFTQLVRDWYVGLVANDGILFNAVSTTNPSAAAFWSRTGTTPPTLVVNHSYPSGPAVSAPATAIPTLVPASDGYILAPGAYMTVTYQVLVGSTPSITTITNTATASSLQSVGAKGTVSNTMKYPGDIAVTEVLTTYSSKIATFDVTVTNVGTLAETNTNVVIPFDSVTPGILDCSGTNVNCGLSTVPPGTSLSYNAGTNTLTWIVGNLAVAESKTLNLTANVVGATGAGHTNCVNLDVTVSPPVPPDSNAANNNACVSFAVPTRVVLTGFAATEERGQVVVEWTTSSEINTAGFTLYRQGATAGGFQRVNARLLPALLDSVQGGTYRLVDAGAMPGESLTYLLVETEAGGAEVTYGPFSVVAGDAGDADAAGLAAGRAVAAAAPVRASRQTAGNPDDPFAGRVLTSRAQGGASKDGTGECRSGDDCDAAYSREPKAVPAERLARLAGAASARETFQATLPPQPGGAVKIAVEKEGLYYLGADEIGRHLGLGGDEVAARLAAGGLAMSNAGQLVAFLPAKDFSGLYFYGQGIDSIYTRENIYWLYPGTGVGMGRLPAAPRTPRASVSFTERVHAEEDRFVVPLLFRDPKADFWLWDYVVGGDPRYGKKTFTVRTEGAVDGTRPATLNATLHGFTDTGVENEHHVRIRLNGQVVGEEAWSGSGEKTVICTFSQGLLRDGDNDLEIEALLDGAAALSIFYVDSFDISYERRYEAASDALAFVAERNRAVNIDGFTSPNVVVFEVANPRRPKIAPSSVVESGDGRYRLGFRSSTARTAPYFAASLDLAAAPARTWPAARPGRLLKRAGAEYVIIAPAELSATAEDLARYRRGQGLTSMVVGVEEIVDQYNYGIASPEAIRGFLDRAVNTWRQPPRYVVLAGEGTYDYRDNLGRGGNLVPPLLTSTPWGLTAADNLFASPAPGVAPRFALGRLPVLTGEELRDLTDKIVAFEASSAGGVVMLADNADAGGDFPADSDDIAALIPPGHPVDRIYLPDMLPGEAHTRLLERLTSGAALVNYFGHGGVDTLAEEGLLTLGDIPLLGGLPRPPVLSAMTCNVSQFAIPGFDSLGEALLLHKGGGAAAVWAPTGLALNAYSKQLAEVFFNAAFASAKPVLGECILAALRDHSLSGEGYTVDSYTLLGDPALVLWGPRP